MPATRLDQGFLETSTEGTECVVGRGRRLAQEVVKPGLAAWFVSYRSSLIIYSSSGMCAVVLNGSSGPGLRQDTECVPTVKKVATASQIWVRPPAKQQCVCVEAPIVSQISFRERNGRLSIGSAGVTNAIRNIRNP